MVTLARRRMFGFGRNREHELERVLKQLLYHAGDDATFEKCREGRAPWPVATVEKARALVDVEYDAFLKSGSPVDSDEGKHIMERHWRRLTESLEPSEP